MAEAASKRMVVEGEEDKFAIIELMGHHIDWPNNKLQAPVNIEIGRSAEEILATGFISSKLKESGVNILGVVLDADEAFDHKWSSICRSCGDFFPDMPKALPQKGLIVQNEDGIRFGLWIMPDNKFHGMLETFLKNLVPDALEPLMTHAELALTRARELGAQCRESHIDKALIHTWLAWQDPPGQPLGRALTKKILDPYHEQAAAFVTWFKSLYGLS